MDIISKPTNDENKPFSPCTTTWDTVKRDTVKRDTVKWDANNNNLLNNNRSDINTVDKHPPNPPAGDTDAAENKGRLPIPERATALEMPSKDRTQSGENLKLKTGGGEDSQSSSHSTTLTDQQFEAFWEAYPRKAAKTAAFKAWKRLNPDAALYIRIIDAIAMAKNTDQWQRENGRYIPNPVNWLNQGRWDDVHPAQAAPAQQPRQSGNAISRILAKIEAKEAARDNEILGDSHDS